LEDVCLHLIYREKYYETQAKDYDFSRVAMEEHWQAGLKTRGARCGTSSCGWSGRRSWTPCARSTSPGTSIDGNGQNEDTQPGNYAHRAETDGLRQSR
jgi:hypothetical protein